jgi:hypothetical protein
MRRGAMAHFGSLEEQENFEGEALGGIIEEGSPATLEDFFEETYDNMFLRDETAIIIYTGGRPFFFVFERGLSIEC